MERIDTRSSVVFLVGDRVFKLKRTVQYGLLGRLQRRYSDAASATSKSEVRNSDNEADAFGDGVNVFWPVGVPVGRVTRSSIRGFERRTRRVLAV